ncbi:MAG: DNA helicase [Labrenzia sp.]
MNTLSTPIFRLKKRAHQLVRDEGIPLHRALDRVAQLEGFRNWSLLANRYKTDPLHIQVLNQMRPGHTLLVGGRPRQGKTKLGLELAARAAVAGGPVAAFSLDYTEDKIQAEFTRTWESGNQSPRSPIIDVSDQICADHIVARLQKAPGCSLVLIDYLQLLDQSRATPSLDEQLHVLTQFAKNSGCKMVFLAQIGRGFENSSKKLPDFEDVRQPNPCDLSRFDLGCFLHGGEVQIVPAP